MFASRPYRVRIVALSTELTLLETIPDSLYAELADLSDVTVFHTRGWHRLLQRSLSWPVHALVGRGSGGSLTFFLPFVTKRRMGRKINVCLPLSHEIGPAHAAALELQDIKPQVALWPLEIHAATALKGMVPASHHLVTRLDLRGIDEETTLWKRLHSAKRRRIAAAEREGVRTYFSDSVADYARFEELQVITRRRQGAPGYPPDFFAVMAEELAPSGASRLFLAEHGGRLLGGVIFLHHGTAALYAYGASVTDRDALRIGVNQAVMWEAIRAAWKDQCHQVDFGSTPQGQTELLRYKEQFGGVSQPLIHCYGSASGLPFDTPQDGALARVGGVVLRHTPLPLFKLVSPILLKLVI